jgi:hypothetical protein
MGKLSLLAIFSIGLSTLASAQKAPTLVSAYLVAKGNATTMVAGGTLQFTAYASYSDGSTGELPDAQGNKITLWNTTNHAIARISTLGHATALGTGTVTVEGLVNTISATPVTVTVVALIPPKATCSANPSIVSPGSSTRITATGTSPQNLTMTYAYSASAGSISGTRTSETLRTPADFEGLITVTCIVDEQDGGATTATTQVLVPVSSGSLDGARDWHAVHDSETPGESRGSSLYPESAPPYNDARKFYLTYSDHGGERFSLTFANSEAATHFVYDAYVDLVDPSQVQNVEMDINQVISNGDTVIFGTQCSGASGTWEYTVDVNRAPHWYPSNIPCDPATWTANQWHHIQIGSSRDSSGNVTYEWVTLDGKTSSFANATGPSALSLGWSHGDLSINFQLDGAAKGSGSITAYVEHLTIYRW